MPLLHQPETLEHLLARLERLREGDPPLWGRMNALEMVDHLRRSLRIAQGNPPQRRQVSALVSLLARAVIYLPVPMPRNKETARDFRAAPKDAAFEQAKRALREEFRACAAALSRPGPAVIHPLFGAISPGAWSRLAVKHTDHHLRQFGV